MFYRGTDDLADDACTAAGNWYQNYWSIDGTIGGSINSGVETNFPLGCVTSVNIYVRKL